MKPNIFILGPSGTGKSTSLRNLNPTEVAILNTELKALPFRNSSKFKLNLPIEDMSMFHKMFDKVLAGANTKIAIIESFTSLVEHQLRASKKMFPLSTQGYDRWGNYKDEIGDILLKSKTTNKYIVFTGIDQVIEGANGVEERCIAVQGDWKKKVEKEFVIILYTVMFTNEKGQPEYKFITNKQEGFENVPAKSPMGMFPLVMPNDLNLIIEYIEKYDNNDTEEVKTVTTEKVTETSPEEEMQTASKQ